MASSNDALGGSAAPSGSAAPGSPPSSTILSRILQSDQVICVAYTDEFSVRGKSLVDLKLGIRNCVVSSNQAVLKNAHMGSLAVVTAQSGHFVIGILGEHTDGPCLVWRNEGGSTFKYAREFTPVTDVLLRKDIRSAWEATCEVYASTKRPLNLFNSRLCGYGTWYMEALHAALRLGVFPLRTDLD
jgi:hypothetical protein